MLERIKSLFGGDRGEPADDVTEVEVQAFARIKNRRTKAELLSAVAALENEFAEKALIAGELRAAQKIQMGLVPKTFPPIKGCLPFDLFAILEPAREIGGDFYDFWLSGRENLVLVIGDVSGKGIPAALFMAICRTYLRAFSRSAKEPAKLLEMLNNEVSRHNETCMFVTLICAVIHIPTGKVTYANAGHNPPYMRKADGNVTVLEYADNMPVGFVHGVKFVTKNLRLETGDSLLFYTDGMPEAFNDQGEIMGEDVAMSLFKASSGGGMCRATVGRLRAEVSEFSNGASQSDDITIMMYTQLDQGGKEEADGDGEYCDDLEGDSSVFTLSTLDTALPHLDGLSDEEAAKAGRK